MCPQREESAAAEIKDLVLARLDDPSPDVRQAAVLADRRLQLREAIPRLVQAAASRMPSFEPWRSPPSAGCPTPAPPRSIVRQAKILILRCPRRCQALQTMGGAVDPEVARPGGTGSVLPDAASLTRFAQSHPGDPRGRRAVLRGKTLDCGRCHIANGRGKAHKGPDLMGWA